ncbi:MAG: hypothetical protein L7V87_04800 [Verrucomicrobiales bacterium]|jgi:hypothetical protein|nr:hypothetical protein [Verrucomicrobiales bacterium]
MNWIERNLLFQGVFIGASVIPGLRGCSVYVKELDRGELFDAMDARRTVAATDKIFMEFSCNGRLMGKNSKPAKHRRWTSPVWVTVK